MVQLISALPVFTVRQRVTTRCLTVNTGSAEISCTVNQFFVNSL